MNRNYVTAIMALILAFAANVVGAAVTVSSSSVAVGAGVVQSVPTPAKKSVKEMSISELLDDLTRDVRLLSLYWDYKEKACTENLSSFKKYLVTVKNINEEVARVRDGNGASVIMLAIDDGLCEIIELLEEQGLRFDINKAFIRSVSRNNKKLVEYLMLRGANIDAFYDDKTPLMHAASKGHLEIVKLLIEANVRINVSCDYGWTALMSAAYHGHYEIVNYLLNAGADVNVGNAIGETALWYAVNNKNSKTVKILVRGGADVNFIYRNGDTALMKAALYGYVDIVKCLIDAGANIDAVNKDNKTALKNAIGSIKVVRHLGRATSLKEEEDFITIVNLLKSRKNALEKLRWSPSYALHLIHSNL